MPSERDVKTRRCQQKGMPRERVVKREWERERSRERGANGKRCQEKEM